MRNRRFDRLWQLPTIFHRTKDFVTESSIHGEIHNFNETISKRCDRSWTDSFERWKETKKNKTEFHTWNSPHLNSTRFLNVRFLLKFLLFFAIQKCALNVWPRSLFVRSNAFFPCIYFNRKISLWRWRHTIKSCCAYTQQTDLSIRSRSTKTWMKSIGKNTRNHSAQTSTKSDASQFFLWWI